MHFTQLAPGKTPTIIIKIVNFHCHALSAPPIISKYCQNGKCVRSFESDFYDPHIQLGELAARLGLADGRRLAYWDLWFLVGKVIGQQSANKQLERVIKHDRQQD